MMHESTAKKRRRGVAERSHQDSPSVTAGEARLAGRGVVQRRTHATRIRKDLSQREHDGESKGKFQAQVPVEGGAEGKSPDSAEKSFPPQRVMIQPASRSIEFNRKRDA